MLEITREDEHDLLRSNEQLIHLGIQGQHGSKFHGGHEEIQRHVRQLYPNAKLVMKIFNPIALIRSCTGFCDPNAPIPFDYPSIRDWVADLGFVDYLLCTTAEEWTPWLSDNTKFGCATYLPTWNLDIDTNWDAIKAEADTIMVDDELDLYSDPLPVVMVYHALLGIIATEMNDIVDYEYKAVGAKDAWLNLAKEYLYKKYSKVKEYTVVDTVLDENGIPLCKDWKPEDNKKKPQQQWWLNATMGGKEIEKIKPKWLGGKEFVEGKFELDNHSITKIHKIV